MQFNSFIFFVFAALFFLGWTQFKKRNQSRWIYLTFASFLFYGWWDWRFLFLIIGSGLIDFLAGLGIVRFSKYRKIFLVLSILGNVGSLAIFKYLDFFIESVAELLGLFGLGASVHTLGIILPVGISFYTFQSMSYTIDIYRGQMKPTPHIFHFFAYLSMFPQLVAGPIVRAKDLLPQLEKNIKVDEQQRWDGFQLIVHGFFKKVVIADNLAPIVNKAFEMSTVYPSTTFWWIIMAMFAFQIYCDFSGYSDIARGLGRWMGFDFGVNFNHPYTSSSFREFWSRWHISLSSWFRDYVYIPLGGSREGRFAMYKNLWLTLLISGLWHGAAFTFIAWALCHCIYLTIEKLTDWPRHIKKIPGGKLVATLIVFMCATIAWVFFRAQSFEQAGTILLTMFRPENLAYSQFGHLIGYSGLFIFMIIIFREVYVYLFSQKPFLWARFNFGRLLDTPVRMAAMVMLIVLSLSMHGPGNQFVYFQF